MRNIFYTVIYLAVISLLPAACNRDNGAVQPENYRVATGVVQEWHRLLLDLERHTPGYRPPVSARMWSYVELAAWQAALPGIPEAVPLGKFVEGLPDPPAFSGDYYLPAGLNAAYAEIFRQFFPTAPPHLLEEIETLESEQLAHFKADTDADVLARSVAHGKKTALDIWRWSATDPFGHEGFLFNFDRNYSPKECAGCWKPGGAHPMPALLPYWGKSRSLLVPASAVAVTPPPPYDDKPGSPFHVHAMEIFAMSKPLSTEHRWIAEFWSDDVPGLTVSPLGHWISITNQALRQAHLPLPQILELYLKAGVSSADVLVICWENKYAYNLERPETYIRRVVDPAWAPLHDSPPFPSYPSGHAAIGAAISEVLTDFLGDAFPLTDYTHEGRNEFIGKPRSFGSFREMAEENALSRIALGVHYRMDCDEGLRLGRLVSKRIAALPFRKQEARISWNK